MTYRALSIELQPIADQVTQFFKADRGVSNFKIEEEVDQTLDYCPTLQGTNHDLHEIWIEVSETPFLESLLWPINHGLLHCLPVYMYVAFPDGNETSDYKKQIERARKAGVGALSVSGNHVEVIHEAVSLSLLGARSPDRTKYRPRYRTPLLNAEKTFRNGDPGKGCALIYDEIEGISRRLERKARQENWWKSSYKPPSISDKTPWAIVMEALTDGLDFKLVPKEISRSLLNSVAALTDPRNLVSHKVKMRKTLLKKQKEMRTRYESAADVLLEFSRATHL